MASLAEILAGGGDPEAQASADASQAMSPVVSPYLAKVLSGALSGDSLKDGLQSVNDAFANHDYPALAGMFAGGGAGIKAYHGSPYDFNAFDASKIGTGEGAQAYGHGLYFAEHPDVAQSYKQDIGGLKAMDAVDQVLKGNAGRDISSGQVRMLLNDPALLRLRDNDAAVDAIRNILPTYDPGRAVTGTALKHYRALDDIINSNPGRMYEVNIDADPEQFLHWDKHLPAQSGAVRQALAENWLAHPTAAINQTGGAIYDRAAHNAAFSQGRGGFDYPGASDVLQQAGIPGIRYLDQGSRFPAWQAEHPSLAGQTFATRKQALNALLDADPNIPQGTLERSVSEIPGDRTSNYVVFDPSIVQILKKYGLAGLLASGGATMGGGDKP